MWQVICSGGRLELNEYDILYHFDRRFTRCYVLAHEPAKSVVHDHHDVSR
jgi:hypothetical protein